MNKGATIYIPDEYHALGTNRPWLTATVLDIRSSATHGMPDMVHYEMSDGRRGWVPKNAVRTIKATEEEQE